MVRHNADNRMSGFCNDNFISRHCPLDKSREMRFRLVNIFCYRHVASIDQTIWSSQLLSSSMRALPFCQNNPRDRHLWPVALSAACAIDPAGCAWCWMAVGRVGRRRGRVDLSGYTAGGTAARCPHARLSTVRFHFHGKASPVSLSCAARTGLNPPSLKLRRTCPSLQETASPVTFPFAADAEPSSFPLASMPKQTELTYLTYSGQIAPSVGGV